MILLQQSSLVIWATVSFWSVGMVLLARKVGEGRAYNVCLSSWADLLLAIIPALAAHLAVPNWLAGAAPAFLVVAVLAGVAWQSVTKTCLKYWGDSFHNLLVVPVLVFYVPVSCVMLATTPAKFVAAMLLIASWIGSVVFDNMTGRSNQAAWLIKHGQANGLRWNK